MGIKGYWFMFNGHIALLLSFQMIYGGKWLRRSGCGTNGELISARFGTGRGGDSARIRINWSNQPAAKTTIVLSDIGLDSAKKYVAYEFWSNRYLGTCNNGTIPCDELPAMGLSSIAIREALGHPQIVSTNRHLSQGGVDLVSVAWSQGALTGKSRVIRGDRYEISVRVPDGYHLKTATIDGKSATVIRDGELSRVSFHPTATGEVAWQMEFEAT
jgi:hypothetical protein